MAIYGMITCFFAFSFIGYLLECVVLSYENKKPVLNRGFGHGPFCIIYGFGALGACAFLQRFSDSPVRLYLATVMMATSMELITAHVMVKLFGSFWWDYSQKPFNYKGMICLESSVAWGFLGIFFFQFLNQFVAGFVNLIPDGINKALALGLLSFYFADFLYTMKGHMSDSDDEDAEPVVGRLKVF